MPPPTSAKKKKQEVMREHRVSNGSHRVDSSVPPKTQPCSTAAPPKIEPDMIHHQLSSPKTLSGTQLNHLKYLNKSNELRRKNKAEEAEDKSKKMKLYRQKRSKYFFINLYIK
jgi:hypothetical protein